MRAAKGKCAWRESGACVVVKVHVISTEELAKLCVEHPELGARAAAALAPRYGRRVLNGSLAWMTRVEALATGLLLLSVHGVDDNGQLSIGFAGKPCLADDSASISISHGGGCCVLASAPKAGGELGIDVEPIDTYNAPAARRVLSSKEIAWIEASDDERRRAERFARAWTALEAVLKAEGTGFERDPRAAGVPGGWDISHVVWRGHSISVATVGSCSIELTEHDPTQLFDRAFC